jgi:hypothetical protein
MKDERITEGKMRQILNSLSSVQERSQVKQKFCISKHTEVLNGNFDDRVVQFSKER